MRTSLRIPARRKHYATNWRHSASLTRLTSLDLSGCRSLENVDGLAIPAELVEDVMRRLSNPPVAIYGKLSGQTDSGEGGQE